MQDYIDLYARNEEDKKNPYFAPYIAEDLTNQPDTLILTCVNLIHFEMKGKRMGNA